MSDLLSEAVVTKDHFARALKALTRLGQVDNLRASEELDHLTQLLEHFNSTVSDPIKNEYPIASTDNSKFDDFRADLLVYLREKAIAERISKDEASVHNARLGPTYWCKNAFKEGEKATFEDFYEILSSHGLESTDEFEMNEAISEAHAGILEIVEAEFSHSGNLEHIHHVVELELRREEKHRSTEYARRIIATCGRASIEIKREKRARAK
tara:strand:- start:565 stop:1197 length:633 start_codon:yes stop_codon:yes gene_type:complete